jgi:biotin operon repressor
MSDPSDFNRQRAEFNTLVRRYVARRKLPWLVFGLANHIAFDELKPNKQSAFISQEELAAAMNTSVRNVRRALTVLEPLGLAIQAGRGRGKASVYQLVPPTIKADTGVPFSAAQKSGQIRSEKRTNPSLKADTGVRPLQDKNQDLDPRESARSRAAPSPDEDFQLFETKEGEILPPLGRSRTAKPAPLPDGWQPDDDGRAYATKAGLTDEDVQDELQKFSNYYVANGARRADWDAAWLRWIDTSKKNRSNQRRTLAGRAGERARALAELCREAEENDAVRRAAGLDPDSVAARERAERAGTEAEAAAQRKAKGPPWSGVMQVIKRKVPPGPPVNKVETSFRLRSYKAGVLEIAVTNEDLYPLRVRENLQHYIRMEYADLDDVRFVSCDANARAPP